MNLYLGSHKISKVGKGPGYTPPEKTEIFPGVASFFNNTVVGQFIKHSVEITLDPVGGTVNLQKQVIQATDSAAPAEFRAFVNDAPIISTAAPIFLDQLKQASSGQSLANFNSEVQQIKIDDKIQAIHKTKYNPDGSGRQSIIDSGALSIPGETMADQMAALETQPAKFDIVKILPWAGIGLGVLKLFKG